MNFIARKKLSKSPKIQNNLFIKRIFAPGKIMQIVNLIEQLPDFIINDKLASDKQLHAVLETFEDANRKVARHYLGSEKLF